MFCSKKSLLILSFLGFGVALVGVGQEQKKPSEGGADFLGEAPVAPAENPKSGSQANAQISPVNDNSVAKEASQGNINSGEIALGQTPSQNLNTKAPLFYAETLNSMGDKEGALQVVKKALQTAPHDPELLALKQALTPHVDTSHGMAALRKAINSWMPWKSGDGLNGPDAGNGNVQYASAIKWAVPNQGKVPDSGGVGASSGYRANSQALLGAKEGLMKLRMGDYSEAEKFFTAKIEEYPYNWLAFRFRALARRNLKNPQGAYDDASMAIKYNSKDAWSYDVRALAAIDLGRYKDAVSDTMLATSLNGRDADAWRTRALAEEKMGQTPQMLADLKMAADLDPQFEAVYRQALQANHESAPPLSHPLAQLQNIPTWVLGLIAFLGTGIGLLLFRNSMMTQVRYQESTFQSPRMEIPAAPLQAGAGTLDNFEIVRKLGQGGMGEVFEGVDRLLDRKVAMKKLRIEIAQDPRERKRFIREARMVAKLQHPNIVQIYSILERPNELFLIFELVDGRTLDRHLIATKGADPMTPREAWDILQPVGAALDHAHFQGIIHRDLKPSNIMVKDKTVKVMDFGIARQVQEILSTMSRQEVIGTPAYMAPEQERGQALKESDLYALGICLYELLTGGQPFPDYDGYALKVKKSFRPPSEKNASLPKPLDRFMERALDPIPENRYHSAHEFLEAYSQTAQI